MVSLILGLGNIGTRYHNTRHNAGFMVLEKLMKQKQVSISTRTDVFESAEITRNGNTVLVAMPRQYMNNSGHAALALCQQNDIAFDQLLVVVDDFNLPLGSLRFRTGGSDGGHNGLASIIEQLGTDQFPRLRLGIGPVPPETDVVDFVLREFTPDEEKPLTEMITEAVEAILFAVDHEIEEAMSKYNKRNPA